MATVGFVSVLTEEECLKHNFVQFYRASAYGNLAMMFPMIDSEEEMDEIWQIIEEVKEGLREKNIPFKEIMTGIMIETPAAVMISDELAEMVDFFSIGTNDLTQYTHAVDRDISIAERYYRPASHAMKKLIRMVVEAAREGGIPRDHLRQCGGQSGQHPAIFGSWACGVSRSARQNLIEVKKALMNARIK